jgi:hypothetical protein
VILEKRQNRAPFLTAILAATAAESKLKKDSRRPNSATLRCELLPSKKVGSKQPPVGKQLTGLSLVHCSTVE